MSIVLKATAGTSAGSEFLIDGEQITGGRAESCEVRVADDLEMAPRHFELLRHGRHWRIEAIDKSHMLVNGSRTQTALLKQGDQFQVGGSVFLVQYPQCGDRQAKRTSGHSPMAALEPFQDLPFKGSDQAKEALDTLRKIEQPLFAVLDAARSPLIVPLLKASGERFESLYSGGLAREMEDCAPYLVELYSDAPLLEQIVAEGWGDAWGIFVTSDLPFEELRRHFKKFLMVRGPEGQEWYFRFYDPRVIRIFLPTCTPSQLGAMFGQIKYYLVESDNGTSMTGYLFDQGRLSGERLLLAETS